MTTSITEPLEAPPPAPTESAPDAEYQEWPFQGFLKRTRIEKETVYNLEFTLQQIPEHLHLPIYSAVLGTGSKEDLPAKVAVSHQTVAPWKPGKELTKEQERLLAKLETRCQNYNRQRKAEPVSVNKLERTHTVILHCTIANGRDMNLQRGSDDW